MVGVDGSEDAESALEKGIELAKKFDARLLIVTVITYPRPTPDIIIAGVIDTSKLEVMLAKYVEKAKKEGLKIVESKLLEEVANEAGSMLVKEAKAQGCALLIVGSRGTTGIKRTLLGSVAGYVAEYTHCDVMITRK